MTNVRSDLRIRRHQSTPACARCRRLKQKCDRGTPKCRRCVTAGVDCTAVNRQTSEELPRSLVQYLEQRLSELQHSTSTQSQYDGRTEGTQSGLNAGPDRDQLLAILTLGFTDRITAKMFKSHSVLQHRAKLFYPSERPPYKIPVRGHYYDAHWKGSYYAHSSHFSNFDAHKVPVHVARRLWDNYKDNILPRFPCFREDDLKTYFDEVYGNTNVDRPHPHASGFIVPLILAISSLTSNSHDFQKVVALSESLHLDAMRHDDVLRDSSILALQCMLLLIQLALVLPYIANLWYLTGETMRMAVSLGLHQELDSVMIASDAVHVEQRRRLFWVIYQLDRTVGIAGGCPLALSDEHITTQLPYGGGDSHISKRIGFKQSKSHSYKEKIFLMHTRLRLIQSEIHGIQFFDQPFTSDVENHEDWVQKTTELIQRLVDQMIASGASPSWLVAAAYQCQILLHRPCSRNITVSNSSLLAAVTASTQLLTSYMGSVQDGGLIMTFELANSAFHAGMVLLYALRNHVPNLEQSSLTDKGPNTLEVLCQLLDILSRSWPALSDTAHYMRELIDTHSRNPLGHNGSAYDMSVLEELDCLITQRRIHSLSHRNIPFPPRHKPASRSRTGENFLDDENWWSVFIHEDFEASMETTNFLSPASAEQRHEIPQSSSSSPQREWQNSNAVVSRSDTELASILAALPACSFCRDRRIKCFQQLPACKGCLQASRQCFIFDPILRQNISLQRIDCLVNKIKSLVVLNRQASSSPLRAPATSKHTVLLPFRAAKQASFPLEISGNASSAVFFGSCSSISYLQRYLQNQKSFAIPRSLQQAMEWSDGAFEEPVPTDTVRPSVSVAVSLFRLYARSVNIFFPILEASVLDRMISQYSENNGEGLVGRSRELFYLILAVATLICKRNEPTLATNANSHFLKAISIMSTDCDHSSMSENITLLQRTLLICVYLLLSPESGDIWRHLGFAIRHFLDLSHGRLREEDELYQVFCKLSRTIYCLESQVSIAFGRPSLMIIGDELRQELTRPEMECPEDQISISSYLISFHKLQIHNALLRCTSNCAPADCQEYRRALDEWFVRWRELVASMPGDGAQHMLLSWGQFNYQHGVFLVSLLGPTPGGKISRLLDGMTTAALQLTRHQQLFGRLYSHNENQKLLMIFPLTWADSHFVLQLALCSLNEEIVTTDEDEEQALALRRYLSLLLRLESDPENLLAGQSLVFEELYKSNRF